MITDQAARQRIATSLDESLLVEAAAGTGKTTVLVERLVAILGAGRTTVDRIVAVTFTRKAAGELKLRLRQGLDRAREVAQDTQEATHLEAAVARLEEAHIGTIHSFCAEILRERPVEAGIDPAFQEIDGEEAARRYERAFQSWIERKLEEMPEGLRRALSRLGLEQSADATSPLERLRRAGYDLVDWRDFPTPWERRPFDREVEMDTLLDGVDELAGLYHRCQNRRDSLRRALEPATELASWIQRSEAVGTRDYDELEARLVDLHRQLSFKETWKGRGKWFAPDVSREAALEARAVVLQDLATFKSRANADLAATLHTELREVIESYEDLKRRAGELDFLDLLLFTRDLVRGNTAVRTYLQERFTHLFVDEFQDTDPLQVEILLLLSADDPKESNWTKVRPKAGRLFLVGDPKQSIYRFRRADVLLYQKIKRRLTAPGGGLELLHLSRNFRAVRPLQEAVNAAFAPQMTGDINSGQPEYIPLDPHREAAENQPHLIALPAPTPFGYSRVTKTQIEACLPDTIAAFTEWMVKESGWTVENPNRRGERVPIAARHIVLLFRRFLSWNSDVTDPYLRGLEARGLPHLLVGGRSFYQREEVETLRAALNAIEWPDDELAVFATLRGDFFALGDDLLLRFRSESGSLHPFRPLAADLPPAFYPVKDALEEIATLHRQRNQHPIVDTIHRLLENSRAHAGFALRPAGNQVLANVQRICDLARSFEMRGGLSFRGFVDRLGEEAERLGSSQAPVLEEGADGVRIMTAHAAKGLEFPVVILADITANLTRRQASLYVDTDRSLAAHQILGYSPWELQDHGDLELERDRAEGLRLAYVAATRARDLLVVPGVGTGPWENGWVSPLNDALYPARENFSHSRQAPGCPAFGATTVLRFADNFNGSPEESIRPGGHHPKAGEHEVVWWDPSKLRLGVEANLGLRREQILSPDQGSTHEREGLERYLGWRAEREQAIATGQQPQFDVITPTEVERPPLDFDASITLEILPRLPGRPSGMRFGTLVHTLLRDVELNAEPTAVAALAELHGRLLGSSSEEIEAATESVSATLAHPLLRRAATAERCHREAPILLRLGKDQQSDQHQDRPSNPGGDRLIEGTLDLAFLDEEIWTVIDFKTDLDLEAQAEKYRRQVAWYVYAMAQLTGVEARGVLLGI
jgi:ATP-dependent exoDNAse (exonuclease V) beta subunit